MATTQSTQTIEDAAKPHLPRVSIEYCTQCRWVLRAGWMAQELLVTFSTLLGEVALIPGSSAVFKVHLDGELIWDRKQAGRFPELKELKTLIRNKVSPDMNLGHSEANKKDETDNKTTTNNTTNNNNNDNSENKTTEECKDCS
ncbi:Rdx family-domain-containing protein [Glomus cerebriforme]|uniref:Rdx family-domain-containing protein n=1 Tax=Glomus cerebriforme TaxID=658196 RepID=A0A397SEX7_9GLOM|nr:Rdx family-domain-containing protein [Glomus cerebriforme]